jgi:hypothetical protein
MNSAVVYRGERAVKNKARVDKAVVATACQSMVMDRGGQGACVMPTSYQGDGVKPSRRLPTARKSTSSCKQKK